MLGLKLNHISKAATVEYLWGNIFIFFIILQHWAGKISWCTLKYICTVMAKVPVLPGSRAILTISIFLSFMKPSLWNPVFHNDRNIEIINMARRCYFDDFVRTQSSKHHDKSIVVAYKQLWMDWIIVFLIKSTCNFTGFAWWAANCL